MKYIILRNELCEESYNELEKILLVISDERFQDLISNLHRAFPTSIRMIFIPSLYNL